MMLAERIKVNQTVTALFSEGISNVVLFIFSYIPSNELVKCNYNYKADVGCWLPHWLKHFFKRTLTMYA